MKSHSCVILCLCYLVIVKCEKLSGYETRTSRDTSGAGHGSPVSHNPVNLLSIERSSAGDTSNTFTIRFTKNVENLVFKLFTFELPGQEPANGEEHEDDAVSAYTFSCNRSESFREVVFEISTMSQTSSIVLVLDNGGEDSVRQDTIFVPEYDVIPAGDIVYHTNHDKSFVVTLTNGMAGGGGDSGNLYTRLHVVDLNTLKFEIIHGNDDFIKETHVNDSTDTLVTIKTSERPVSGMLDLTYSWRGGMEDLVQEVLSIRSSVVLRPFTQAGPFPIGYVSFVDRDPEYCPTSSDCPVSCVAVGDSVSAVRVQEMIPSGVLKEVPSATEPPDNYPRTRYLRWIVSDSSTSSDGSGHIDDIRWFRCQAMDEAHGTIAETMIEVRLYTKGKIIEERSNYTLESTNATSIDAVLSCAFSGRPLPNVTFTLEYEYNYLYNEAVDQVIPTGENEALAVKHVTFDTEIGNDYFWDANGRLVGAICLVEQLDANAFDHYNLPLVGEDQPPVDQPE